MVGKFRTVALAGVLAMAATPVFAFSITLPFIGDPMHPDLDPLHIMSPAPAEPAAAPAPAPMMKHHKHHKMKKKMMKKAM